MQPALADWRKPWIGFQWLFFRRGPGATNHFEGGGFVRSNDEVAYPNLMFHFLPLSIRYDGTGPKGGHGYQVHVGPMYSDARGSVKITSTDPTVHPALRFNYLSTDQDRREWVEAIRVARRILGQPALAEFDGGETSPGAARRDRPGDPRLGRPRCRNRAPSVVHRPDGHGRDVRHGPADDAGPRPRRAPGRRRERHALRHERQHLRAGDDARREGGRPDPRQHAVGAGADRVLPPLVRAASGWTSVVAHRGRRFRRAPRPSGDAPPRGVRHARRRCPPVVGPRPPGNPRKSCSVSSRSRSQGSPSSRSPTSSPPGRSSPA